MTKTEAKKIVREIGDKNNVTEEEKFLLTEALGFLIRETQDPRYMMHLGGIYYEDREFDLALKYYEMAAAQGYEGADECLGYIWYYGRTGVKDYQKAFEPYSRAAERGNLVAKYKVADMYKNGYYVEKDYDKYCEIIESLYPLVCDAQYLNEPLPEVYLRLAAIRREQGRIDEAINLLFDAKEFLIERLIDNPFFGDISNMEWVMREIRNVALIDKFSFDLYDLFYLLEKPRKIRFSYKDAVYEVESAEEDGRIAVRFGEKWYRSIKDFFLNAEIGGKKLVTMPYDLYDFEVV